MNAGSRPYPETVPLLGEPRSPAEQAHLERSIAAHKVKQAELATPFKNDRR